MLGNDKNKNNNNFEYISLQDATKFCNYSQEYLSLRARQGKLKSMKLGRNWVTTKEWLVEYAGKVDEYNDSINNNGQEKPQIFHAPPENLPIIRSPKIKLNFGTLRPGFAAALVLVLITAGGVFGKEGLLKTYDDIAQSAEKIVRNMETVSDDVLTATVNYKNALMSVSGTLSDYGQWFKESYSAANKKVEQKIGNSLLSLRSVYSSADRLMEQKLTVLAEDSIDGYSIAQNYLRQKFVKTPGAAGNFVKEKVAETKQSIKNFEIGFKSKTMKLVLAVGEPFIKAYNSITRGVRFAILPWQGVVPGDFEELRTKMAQLEKEPVVIKRIEVSKVVEPVKEITREVETIKQITRIDDAALAEVRANMVYLEGEIGKRLYAPGGVVSQTIYMTEPVRSPKIYQENGEIVLQTAGSGNVILSAATGLQLYGQQVVLESTSLLNPLIYLADNTKISGTITASGAGSIGGNLGVGGTAAITGDLTVSGNFTLGGTQTLSSNLIVNGTATSTFAGPIAITTSTASQLKLAYDSSNYTNFGTNSVGDLTITPSGEDVTITGNLLVTGSNNIAGGASFLVPVTITTTSVPQFLVRYDADNELNLSVANDGALLFLATGTDADIELSTKNFDDAFFIDDSTGRIGVGTTTPRYKLDVWGDMAIGTSTGTNVPALYIDSGNGGGVGIGTTTVAGTLLTVGTTTPSLVVASNGYVGIGTASPTEELHLSGSGFVTNFYIEGSQHAHVDIKRGSNSHEGLIGFITTLVTDEWAVGLDNDETSNFYIGSASLVNKYFTIMPTTGNVGIATTSPRYKLDVWGDMAIGTSTGVGAPMNYPLLFVDSGGSSNGVGIGTTTVSGTMLTVGTTTPALVVAQNGYVGIGTTGPLSKFDVSGGGNGDSPYNGVRFDLGTTNVSKIILGNVIGHTQEGYILYDTSDNHMAFGGYDAASVTNKERVRIDNAGNVGIGNAAPSSRLTVNGGSLTVSTNGTATTTISSGVSYFAGGLVSQASSTFANNLDVNGDITISSTTGALYQPIYGSDDGLVLYLPFSEGMTSSTANTAYDRSPYGNDGTLTSMGLTGSGTSGWATTTCKAGSCINFDGTNDYVDAGNGASLDITGDITVEFWFQSSISQSNVGILGKWAANAGYTFYIYPAEKIVWQTDATLLTYTTAISLNTWYHVVGIRRGNNNELFVNGNSVAGPTAATLTSTATHLSIGEYGGTQFFNGIVDEVRIYNRALSANEVRTHYLRGTNANGAVLADKFRVIGTDNNIDFIVNAGDVGIGTSTPAARFVVNSAAISAFVVTSAGQVGIGTAAPGYKLDVQGSTATFYSRIKTSATDGQAGLFFENDAQSWLAYVNNADNFYISDQTGTAVYPFAIEANTPDNTLYLDSTGNVGIGTASPSQKLTVFGGNLAVTTDGTATTTISSGVSIFAGGMIVNASSTINHNLTVGTSTAPTLFVDSGNGRVGIGTATPLDDFQVAAETGSTRGIRLGTDSVNSWITVDRAATNRGGVLYYRTEEAVNWAMGVADSDNAGDGSEFYIGQAAGGTNANFWIETSGNVGIGTIGPSDKLTVFSGNISVGGGTATTTITYGATGAATSTFAGDISALGVLSVGDGTATSTLRGGTATSTISHGLIVDTNSLYVMADTGYVGIGTATPTKELHVVGTGNTIVQVESSGTDTGPKFRIVNDARTWEIMVHGGDADKFKIFDAIADLARLAIDTSGNVGIATSSPRYTLDVWGDMAVGTSTGVGTPMNYPLLFVDSGGSSNGVGIGTTTVSGTMLTVGTTTPALVVANNGYVGIGTASPKYKLDVLGTGQFFTAPYPTSTSLTIVQAGRGKIAEFKTHLPGASNLMIDASLNELSTILIPKSSLEIRQKASISWTSVSVNWLPADVGAYAAPAFADIDNDGDYDLAVGDNDGLVEYFRNDGTASSPSWTSVSVNWLPADVGAQAAPAFADIDNDGDYDLAVGDEDGLVEYFRNDGTASSPSWTSVSVNWLPANVGAQAAPAFADIDNDGDYDLAVGDYDGYVEYFRNDGSASSPSWTSVSVNWLPADVGTDTAPAFADIDNDGDYDLAVGDTDGLVEYFRNDGADTSVFFGNFGNVGIATTSPRYKLDVYGTMAVGTSTASYTGTLSTPALYVLSGNGGQVGIGTTTLGTALLTVGTTTPSLVVASNGYVGIGTASPTSLLTVAGDADITGDTISFGTAGPTLYVRSMSADLQFYVNGAGTMTIGDGNDDVSLDNNSFFVESDNGNVGIATTTPRYNLDVWGDMAVGTSTGVGTPMNYPLLFVDSGGSSNGVGIGTTTVSGTMLTVGTTTPALVVANNGYVGIGTTTPAGAFQLGSGIALFPDGTGPAPSIAFGSEPGTGIWRKSGSELAFAVSNNSAGGLVMTSLNGSDVQLYSRRDVASADLYFATMNGVGAQANRLRIHNNAVQGSAGITSYEPLYVTATADSYFTGDVGIATTTPRYKLDVWGSLAIGTSTGADLFYANTGNSQITIGGDISMGSIQVASSSGAITFADMIVEASASAGTEESYNFFIDSSQILTIYSESDGAGGIRNKGILIGTTTFSGLLTVGTSTPSLVVAANGKVGIGTATPTSTLSVYGDIGQRGNILHADVAEDYPVSDNAQAGDVVEFDPQTPWAVRKSTTAYSERLAGVISTSPGYRIYADDPNWQPIALAGRVPVKVSLENGPIAIGDALTSASSTPGVAMKATGPGKILGYALEPFNGLTDVGLPQDPMSGSPTSTDAVGKIMVFVSLSERSAGDLTVFQNAEGNLEVRTLTQNGLATLFSIDAEGALVVNKIKTQQLCVGSVCVTETDFMRVFGASAAGTLTTSTDSVCTNGANRPCSSEVGACQIGVEICEGGQWGSCLGAVFPTAEICDEVDNDCDGTVDEGGVCSAIEPEPEPEPITTSTEPIVEPIATSTDGMATTTP